MADDSEQVSQDDIEQMLSQSQGGDGGAETPQPDQQSSAGEGSGTVDPSEIEALLGDAGSAPAAGPLDPPAATTEPTSETNPTSQNDIELLLSKAEQALDSIDQTDSGAAGILPPGIKTFEFKPFSGTAANTEVATLELMRDVQLDMTIELGRTHMHLEDVLKLKQGSVVPLDKLAGDPADIFVNGRLVARGEVLVLNDNFCIRVAELIVGESVCA